MWPSLVLLALLAAIDPGRLAVIMLVASRPRPVANLLAYGAGSLTACSYMLVLPLALLNSTGVPAQSHASSTVRHVQLGIGAAALIYAVVAGIRLRLYPTAGGRHRATADTAARRMLGRARGAWERGGVWMAAAVGIGIGGPPWDAVAFLLAMVALSGAALSVQIGAAVTLVVGMLAVVEVALIAHLVRPKQAQALLVRFKDWAWGHRRHVVASLAAMAGVSLLVNGSGVLQSLVR